MQSYRQRQHHEQRYRVLLHDAFVDTVPSGYNKHSRNVKRPGSMQNAVGLYAWICGVCTAALERLGPGFVYAHPRTLRRYFLCLPAELHLVGTERLRPLWETLLRRLNRDPVRIPWLQNRELRLALDKKISPPKAAPLNAPTSGGLDVWC